MPEVRRRGLSDQLGVGADRTQRGAGQGGGIGPTIARLQQAYRSRQSASVSAAAATLDGTTYGPVEGGSSAQITDLPAGIYAVTAVLSLAWGSPLAAACTASVAVEDDSSEVAAGSGSAAIGGTQVKASAPGFATVSAGSSLTATPTIEGGGVGAVQTVTLTAIRLGAVQF